MVEPDPLNHDAPTIPLGEFLARLEVEAAGEDRFTVVCPGWWGTERVFGGMLLAHALSAALRTVGDELSAHSVHLAFLRPVLPGATCELSVRRTRDGRSFATRQVTTTTGGKEAVLATVSFHRPEPGDEYQLARSPSVPGPIDLARADERLAFDIRDLGASERRADGSCESTHRMWIRVDGELGAAVALHQVLLSYISDMTSASFRPHSLWSWGAHSDASLDHALWFHRPLRADRWIYVDFSALVNAGGRATVRGVFYDEGGQLCASMAQELLIRPLGQPDEHHRVSHPAL